jgi:hypothetical protein
MSSIESKAIEGLMIIEGAIGDDCGAGGASVVWNDEFDENNLINERKTKLLKYLIATWKPGVNHLANLLPTGLANSSARCHDSPLRMPRNSALLLVDSATVSTGSFLWV